MKNSAIQTDFRSLVAPLENQRATQIVTPFMFLSDMELPNDSMILFSFINTKLRDVYSSLDDLCEDLHVDKKELLNKLGVAGFEYNPEQNKFW